MKEQCGGGSKVREGGGVGRENKKLWEEGRREDKILLYSIEQKGHKIKAKYSKGDYCW